MAPVLTFICAGIGLTALLAGIGLLLGPSRPPSSRRRHDRARRAPRRFARGARRRGNARLAARRARAMNAAQAAHVLDLSAASDEADRSA